MLVLGSGVGSGSSEDKQDTSVRTSVGVRRGESRVPADVVGREMSRSKEPSRHGERLQK